MDEKTVKRRLLSLLPAASLHMNEFLALTSIRFVKGNSITETACVTNEANPTLYLNEDFLNAYCQSDEHLLMLLMHELYHIVLGHTCLFKKTGLVDNIAFDAIINAVLCRSFKEERYVSFFTSVNSDDSPIGALLRPIGEKTPESYKPLLKKLYQNNTTTYYELYQKIRKFIVERELVVISNGGRREEGREEEKEGEKEGGETSSPFILLGGHKEEKANPLLGKAAEEVVRREYLSHFSYGEGRDLDGEMSEFVAKMDETPFKTQVAKMKRLIRKALARQDGGKKYVKAFDNYIYDGKGTIPNFKDRTALAKMSLGMKPLLYKKPYSMKRYQESPCGKSLVYLDVSGSVTDEIGKLFYLLRAPYQRKECDLYGFSTMVSEIKYGDFKKGRYETTGGTSIDCIMDHFFSLPKEKRGKRILILTDGFTGQITERHRKLLEKEKVSLYCGFFGTYLLDYLEDDLTYYETFGVPYDFEAD